MTVRTKCFTVAVLLAMVVGSASAAEPEIESIAPNTVYLAGLGVVGNIQVNGSGFSQAGCQMNLGDFGALPLAAGTADNQILVNLAFGGDTYRPKFYPFSVTCPSGTSNAKQFAFVGDQNTLAASNSTLFQLQQGAYAADGSPHIWKFALQNGAAVPDGALVPYGGPAIAMDDKTGYVLRSDGRSVEWLDLNGNTMGVAGNPNPLTPAAAAKGGYGCNTRPFDGLVQCFDLTQFLPPTLSVAVPDKPSAIAMVRLGNELDAIVYTKQNPALYRVSVPDMVIRGVLPLPDIMSEDNVWNQLGGWMGGWQVAAFSSGPAAGTAALLAQADKKLVIVDLNAMTELRRIDLGAALDNGLFPIRLAADEAHGKILVAVADPGAGLSRFVSVDMRTGAVANLTATTDLLAVGFGVSPDGAQMYACGWDKCRVLATDPVATLSMDKPAYAVGDAWRLSLATTNVPAGSHFQLCSNNGLGCFGDYALNGTSWTMSGTWPAEFTGSWEMYVKFTGVTSNKVMFTVGPVATLSADKPAYAVGDAWKLALSTTNIPVNSHFALCANNGLGCFGDYALSGTSWSLSGTWPEGFDGRWEMYVRFSSGVVSNTVVFTVGPVATLAMDKSSYAINDSWTLSLTTTNVPANSHFQLCANNGLGCFGDYVLNGSNWSTSGTWPAEFRGSWEMYAKFNSGVTSNTVTFTVGLA